jgi:hypothetical protein
MTRQTITGAAQTLAQVYTADGIYPQMREYQGVHIRNTSADIVYIETMPGAVSSATEGMPIAQNESYVLSTKNLESVSIISAGTSDIISIPITQE